MKHLGDYSIPICCYPCLETKFPLIPITGDRSTTHKLKPRSLNKLFSAPTSFTCHQSLLLGFILLLSNISLWRSTLIHSGVYFLSITLHLCSPKFCHVLILMSCQSTVPFSGSNSIPLADQTIGCFTSGLPRRSRCLQLGISHTLVHLCLSPLLVEPSEFHGVDPTTIPYVDDDPDWVDTVTLLENFLQKYSMGYTLYPRFHYWNLL